MEEACRALSTEVGGLRVLLRISREEAEHHERASNRHRNAAEEWKAACGLAQKAAETAAAESEATAAALARVEARLKQLERQGRRRSSTSSLSSP